MIYIINICINEKEKNFLILIDEICNNLSVNTQYSLLKYLKSVISENKNIFVVLTTHSPVFFWKEQNDKYSDYLNVVICESDRKNGLHYTSYVDIDTSIKQGIEMKSKKILEGYDVLSKILDYPVEKLKKFKI